MRSITEEQDRIDWAFLLQGRATKRIRYIQTMYRCIRGTAYTKDQRMRGFIHNLMGLTHEQWLGLNLMKHQRTKGAIAIKTRGQLSR